MKAIAWNEFQSQNKISRFNKMINFQMLGHFLIGYRNKTECIASCNLRGDELPKSLEEIDFIRDVITSIKFEHCAQAVVSNSALNNLELTEKILSGIETWVKPEM